MFDFMVDALAAMLSRANESHHIQGWFNISFPEEWHTYNTSTTR
jgi:hypothetical protein